jgi:hypothetical protein
MPTSTEVLRTEQINLKLTADEVAKLKRLAEHYAISPQSVLRMLLKQASDALATTSTLSVPAKPRRK